MRVNPDSPQHPYWVWTLLLSTDLLRSSRATLRSALTFGHQVLNPNDNLVAVAGLTCAAGVAVTVNACVFRPRSPRSQQSSIKSKLYELSAYIVHCQSTNYFA